MKYNMLNEAPYNIWLELGLLQYNITCLNLTICVFVKDLPTEVDNYHELVPLEQLPSALHKPQMINYHTSTYKATNVKTGTRYCLRRIHGTFTFTATLDSII